MKKFALTDETIQVGSLVLYRIICTVAFENINVGQKGGYIEKEDNLSGNAWVFGDARVSGNAEVSGNARVSGNAEVSGNARVSGNAEVSGNAWVFGDARVSGNAEVSGNALVFGYARVFGDARVSGNADYIVFKNWWSSGRYFTWTRSNNMWIVGCFYGTGKELIKKAYADSEISGREYERIVKYVEQLKQEGVL